MNTVVHRKLMECWDGYRSVGLLKRYEILVDSFQSAQSQKSCETFFLAPGWTFGSDAQRAQKYSEAVDRWRLTMELVHNYLLG
jgi:hypothetical protein